MGGTNKQTQDVNQVQTQAPWAPAIPLLTGITDQATGLLGNTAINPTQAAAFNQLSQNAQAGNPYAPAIGGYATNLLGGGGANAQAPMLSGALGALQSQLSPYASGSQIGANNPYVSNLVDTLGTDIQGKINAQYAGAGRDLSGLNALNVSRGLAQGLAPTLLGQYNTDVQNQMNAANTLYGAANTTGGLLSGLNQTALGNMGTGVDAATAALAARDSAANQQLAIEAAKQGIPIQNLSALAQLGVPIAQLGGTGTRTGTVTGTNTLSPAQQAWGWMSAFANLGNAFKPAAPASPAGGAGFVGY